MKWKIIGIILLAVIGSVGLIKAPIASWYLTRSLKVPVSLSSFNIWPSEITISSFKIKNPKQFKSNVALVAKSIEADFHFKKIFGNPSEIARVEMDDVYLVIQLLNPLGTENNWTIIAQDMSSNKAVRNGTIIHKLIVSNLTVEVQDFFGGSTVTKYGQLEIDEVSSKTGFPTSSIIQQLFTQVDLLKYIPDAFNYSDDVIEDVLSPFINNF